MGKLNAEQKCKVLARIAGFDYSGIEGIMCSILLATASLLLAVTTRFGHKWPPLYWHHI